MDALGRPLLFLAEISAMYQDGVTLESPSQLRDAAPRHQLVLVEKITDTCVTVEIIDEENCGNETFRVPICP